MSKEIKKRVIIIIMVSCLSSISFACNRQSDYERTNIKNEISTSPIEIEINEDTIVTVDLKDDITLKTSSEHSEQDNPNDLFNQKSDMKTDVILEHKYVTHGNYLKCISFYDSSKHIEYEPSSDDLENIIYSGEIVELDYETELNLNSDKIREKIKLTWVLESDLFRYRLEVGTCVIERVLFATYDGFRIRGAVINSRFDSDIYILVSYPARDIMYYEDIYHYDYESYSGKESLQYIGTTSEICNLSPYGFKVYEFGKLLQTWSYEIDYSIGNGYILDNDKNNEYFEFIYPVKQGNYPMGTICKLKQDIILYKRKADDKSKIIISKDSYVELCECDDEQWLFVRDSETSEGGWLEFDLNGNCIQGDKTFEGHEIFDGLRNAG